MQRNESVAAASPFAVYVAGLRLTELAVKQITNLLYSRLHHDGPAECREMDDVHSDLFPRSPTSVTGIGEMLGNLDTIDAVNVEVLLVCDASRPTTRTWRP